MKIFSPARVNWQCCDDNKTKPLKLMSIIICNELCQCGKLFIWSARVEKRNWNFNEISLLRLLIASSNRCSEFALIEKTLKNARLNWRTELLMSEFLTPFSRSTKAKARAWGRAHFARQQCNSRFRRDGHREMRQPLWKPAGGVEMVSRRSRNRATPPTDKLNRTR